MINLRGIARAEELMKTELTAEQKQAILSAPDFSAFIEASTRIAQRALSDGYDYVKDYTIGLDGALWVVDGFALYGWSLKLIL